MAGLSIFFWGTMTPVSKKLLSDLSNMEMLGYGSAIAAVFLFAVLLFSGQWRQFACYSVRDYMRLLLTGIVGYFLYSALYYQGVDRLPAQTTCILNYLWPIFTVCLSAVMLKESFSFSKIGALLLSFLGTVVIFLQSGSTGMGQNTLEGYFCCILAAFLYAVFNVLNKKWGGNQLINMFLYIGSGAVLAFACSAREGISIPERGQIAGLLWFGICINALGFLLWAKVLQQSKIASVANAAYFTPVVSLILSAVVLHEPIYPSSVIGLGLILGGFLFQLLYMPDRPSSAN